MGGRLGIAPCVQLVCARVITVALLLSVLSVPLLASFVALDDGPGCKSGLALLHADACQEAAASLGYGGRVVVGVWEHAPRGCVVGHGFDGWANTYYNDVPETQQTTGSADYRSICTVAVDSTGGETEDEEGEAEEAAALATEPAGSVSEEFFRFLASNMISDTGAALTICFFGVGDHTANFSRRVLRDKSPPLAHVRFLRARAEAHGLVAELSRQFPGRVSAEDRSLPDGQRPCSVLVLAVEDPRFHAEELRAVADGVDRVILAYLSAHCTMERSHECRFFHSAWEGLLEAAGVSAPSCTQYFCAVAVPTMALADPALENMDCASLTGPEARVSPMSQWQQDWFVYHNFFKGTDLDAGGGGVRRGVFVDIGAFHPIHLSNTLLFERCLGWHGLTVEPNPGFHAYFRAYRTAATLVPHCVWSRPRSVVMSFHKDPIEAYIQEDDSNLGEVGEGVGSGANGAVLIQGDGAGKPRFEATCRTLEDILASNGLRKPATIDYMSVDAEAAEVEIFRHFPFDDFDLRVVSVEVQTQNYYELDTIFFSAGYAKVGVLGGDHVYAKLQHPTTPPVGMADWHRTLGQNFHSHAKPKTAVMS